jgi:hypothetical protein
MIKIARKNIITFKNPKILSSRVYQNAHVLIKIFPSPSFVPSTNVPTQID